jgi:hypothetical protein
MDKPKNVSLLHKIVVCLLTAILSTYTLKRFGADYLPNWLPNFTIPVLFWLFLPGCILFIPIWQYQERKNKINSTAALGFFQSVLVYFLAFDFTKWAFLKFLRLHMTTSLGWMEMPMTMLSGEQQLSHFFGQNYPMVVAFGLCEITGAILILFRRTRLLGLFVLIVMSANIVLIDFLYGVKGPLPEAFLLLVTALYLVLQDYDKIISFFFSVSSGLPKFQFNHRGIKNLLRVSAIAIPAFILMPNYQNQFRPALTGKYKIIKMTVNGQAQLIDSCNANAFSTLYFDLGDFLVFSSNDFNKRQVAHFEFDKELRQLKAIWQYPKGLNDTLLAKVSTLDNENRMTISGTMGQDTIDIALLKKDLRSVTTRY